MLLEINEKLSSIFFLFYELLSFFLLLIAKAAVQLCPSKITGALN